MSNISDKLKELELIQKRSGLLNDKINTYKHTQLDITNIDASKEYYVQNINKIIEMRKTKSEENHNADILLKNEIEDLLLTKDQKNHYTILNTKEGKEFINSILKKESITSNIIINYNNIEVEDDIISKVLNSDSIENLKKNLKTIC